MSARATQECGCCNDPNGGCRRRRAFIQTQATVSQKALSPGMEKAREYVEARKQIKDIQAKLSRGSDARVGTRASDFQSTAERNVELASHLAITENRCRELDLFSSSAMSKLNEFSVLTRSLEDQKVDSELRVVALTTRIAETEALLDKMWERMRELEQERNAAAASKQSAEQALETSEALSLVQCSSSVEEMHELERRHSMVVSERDQSYAKLKEAMARVDNMQTRCKDLQQTNSIRETEAHQMRNEAHALRVELEGRAEALRESHQAFHTQRTALEDQRSALGRAGKEQEAAAEQKYSLLFGKYENKEVQLDELRRDLQAAFTASKGMRAECNTYDAQTKILWERINSDRSTHETSEVDLRNELSTTLVENASLQGEAEELRRTVELLREHKQGAEGEVDELRRTVELLREGKQGSEGEVDQLRQTVELLREGKQGAEGEAKELRQTVEHLHRTLAGVREGRQGAEGEAEELRRTVELLREGKQGADSMVDQLRQTVELLREGKQAAEAEAEEFRQTVEPLREDKQGAEGEAEDLRRAVELLRQDKQGAEGEAEELRRSMEQLHGTLAGLREGKHGAEAETKEQLKTIEALRGMVESLKTRVESAVRESPDGSRRSRQLEVEAEGLRERLGGMEVEAERAKERLGGVVQSSAHQQQLREAVERTLAEQEVAMRTLQTAHTHQVQAGEKWERRAEALEGELRAAARELKASATQHSKGRDVDHQQNATLQRQVQELKSAVEKLKEQARHHHQVLEKANLQVTRQVEEMAVLTAALKQTEHFEYRESTTVTELKEVSASAIKEAERYRTKFMSTREELVATKQAASKLQDHLVEVGHFGDASFSTPTKSPHRRGNFPDHLTTPKTAVLTSRRRHEELVSHTKKVYTAP